MHWIAGGRARIPRPQLTFQPGSGLATTLGPYYYAARQPAQYLKNVNDTTATATGGARYVFAGLEERMVNATVRVNATFSPRLSLQVYAQRFAFSGAYDGFGELAAPFGFSNPDFRTRSLRVNSVLRWEYRQGSTLYLAWTQSRSAYLTADGSFEPGRDLTALWDDRPTNVLLLKISYWLSP